MVLLEIAVLEELDKIYDEEDDNRNDNDNIIVETKVTKREFLIFLAERWMALAFPMFVRSILLLEYFQFSIAVLFICEDFDVG
mmetsp:Transcript_14877/g.21296  ORF Transcript_14877/g.21296 Transcript_14877/m.21296 type:complete len:83 (+) Transcript_14877:1879-2127(+)